MYIVEQVVVCVRLLDVVYVVKQVVVHAVNLVVECVVEQVVVCVRLLDVVYVVKQVYVYVVKLVVLNVI